MKKYKVHKVFAKIFLTFLALFLLIGVLAFNMEEIDGVRSFVNGLYESITSRTAISDDTLAGIRTLALDCSVIFLLLAIIAINNSYSAANRAVARGSRPQVTEISVYTNSKKDSKKMHKKQVEEQKMKSKQERLAEKEAKKAEKLAKKASKKAEKKAKEVAEKVVESAAAPVKEEVKAIKDKKIDDILNSIK